MEGEGGQKLMMRNKECKTREGGGAESFLGDDEGFVLAVGVSAGN